MIVCCCTGATDRDLRDETPRGREAGTRCGGCKVKRMRHYMAQRIPNDSDAWKLKRRKAGAHDFPRPRGVERREAVRREHREHGLADFPSMTDPDAVLERAKAEGAVEAAKERLCGPNDPAWPAPFVPGSQEATDYGCTCPEGAAACPLHSCA